MDLQGEKAAVTQDFLSLRRDSSWQDARPPPQGLVLTTHEFLQPLDRLEKNGGRGAARAGEATPAAIDLNVAAAPVPTAEKSGSAGHVLPGGCLVTHGIGDHVHGYAGTAPVVVKPEWPPSPGVSAAETKAGTRCGGVAGVQACKGNRNAAGRNNSGNPGIVYAPVCSREGTGIASRGPQHQHLQQRRQQQWPSPSPFPTARGFSSSSFPPSSSSWKQPAQERRHMMDTAARSNNVFADDDDDDDDDELGKSDTSSHKGLTVKVDGGNDNNNNNHNSNNDQKPSTPRSKHSATEQRRRSKINDRFQILRSLIPHTDQKRDKASFLLEVIEYIQYLQERVQKYEVSYPGWNHDNVKLMPWKNSQTPGESMMDPSHIMKNGTLSSSFIYPGDGTIASAPAVMLNAQNVAESENVSCGLTSKSASVPVALQYPPGGAGSGFFLPQQRVIPDSENMAAQAQAQCLRSCTTDCSVSTDILNGQDDLVVDEGTISLSSMYSEGLLNGLTQALQSSGIDLSRASISVQVDLGRRAVNRPTSSTKEHDDPSSSNQILGHSRVGSSGEESEQANKRHKSCTS